MIYSAAIFLAFIGMTLLYIRNIISSHRYMKRTSSIHSTVTRNVILLIPVYKEAEIIEQTYTYFAHIAKTCGVKAIFITTEAEGSTSDNATYALLDKLSRHNKDVELKHYDGIRASKAAQVNAVMNDYKNKTDYFAIFDADSRPDPRGIQFVLQSDRQTDVFQMPSVYLPHKTKTMASQTMAVFQTKWSYCFEIPKWRKWQNRADKPHVMYIVGHGLFIKNHIRFSENTITEDLELGYRLSARCATMTLVPYFDYARVPQKFVIAVIQSSRWYYGELLSPLSFWKYAPDANIGHRSEYATRSVIRYAQILLWMVGPVFVITSLVVSMGSPVLLTLGLASVALYWLMHVFICHYGHASYRSLLLIPVKLVINGVGPMLCVLYTLFDLLEIKEFRFVKTAR
jgi:cellulose synthase/poly-beta-1,6-N-acetylglucosamine synthase-like glycosyltransferase